MVEHPVEKHPDPARAGGVDERHQVGLIAQAGVDGEEIQGVVSVGVGGEHRAEQHRVAPEFHHVVQPLFEDGQAVCQLLGLAREDGRTGGAEGVDMPDDRVFSKTHGSHTSQDGVALLELQVRRSTPAPR